MTYQHLERCADNEWSDLKHFRTLFLSVKNTPTKKQSQYFTKYNSSPLDKHL